MAETLAMAWDAVEDVPVLSMAGSMYYPDSAHVMRALSALLTDAPGGAAVVDVSRLRAPYSSALLMVFPAAVRRCGGWPQVSLHLAAPATELGLSLRAQRIPQYVSVHETVAEALLSAELDRATRRSEVTLPAVASSLRSARRAVMDAWAVGPTSRLEDALLVVNELADNAIEHVGEPFSVAVACTATRGLVAVSDGSADEPSVAPCGEWIEHGVGIRVVQEVSQSWEVRLRLPRGKTVWAELDDFDGP